MTDTFIKRDFLAQYGFALIDQGYSVVPTKPGKKAPGFDGWQKAKSTKDQVREWLSSGFKNYGVGILTKFSCAIDIDCLDEQTALKFEAWCLEKIGTAPVRIGKAPKRLLLYRTVEPFKKRRSKEFRDEWNDKQLIEVLGDGQQFVAFHIHPETGKPYTWVDDKSPLNIRLTDLTEVSIDQIDSLISDFEAHARAEGWKVEKDGLNGKIGRNGKVDTDNPWIEDTQPIDISADELRTRLMLIEVDKQGYEGWNQVGMALYHQYSGDQEGLDLWIEWSETSMNFDLDEIQRKWPTFSVAGKKRAPLTARYIMRLAKESVEATALEISVKLRDAFINAKDLREWEQARQQARNAEIDGLARSALALVAKERRDAITGTKTSIVEIKKAISYLPKKMEKAPTWSEGWVYDTAEDKFFHLDRKISVTKQGFDAMYDRYALTKADILNGRAMPSQSASDLVLNLYRVETVDNTRYMPGRDSIFHEPDGKFANTYPEHEIPEKPDKILPRDRKNIERVKNHIAHLIAKPEEQRMLLDWLSWVVQNPGKHVNYSVLLQGVPGDGKTFFAEMLRAVMGVSNVTMAIANTIINSNFTAWAYGQCVLCVEEVRLANSRNVDKWDAINKIKPFITNNVVEIHPKGGDPVNVLNTTSYLLFSNFKDALPLDDNDRRYYVLFSKWQTRDAIDAFVEANPDYYDRLYQAIVDSPGAIRQWLLEHEQASAFKPRGVAPDTDARRVMIRKSKPEIINLIDELIAEDETVGASKQLIDITELAEVTMGMGVEWPSPKTLSAVLERDGYESLGKARLGDETRHSFYSKNPERFQSDGFTDSMKIKQYIKARRSAMDLDDEL